MTTPSQYAAKMAAAAERRRAARKIHVQADETLLPAQRAALEYGRDRVKPSAKPPVGRCSTCDRPIKLDARGRINEHLRSRPGPGERYRCDGSGQPPRTIPNQGVPMNEPVYVKTTDIPADLRWDVPARLDGQIIEVAYAGSDPFGPLADVGAPFRRVTDRSRRVESPDRVTYYALATS